MQEFFIFSIAVLIMSIVVHEVSHGYVAEILGDPTARLAGRLTLNPLHHLDPFGSVILPLMLFFTNSPFMFGWAKPVPYNEYNLRNGKWGPGLVALAGPLANIFIATFFSFLIRFGVFPDSVTSMAGLIVLMNLMLAFFNLIPIPPLDGSKVVASFLPRRYYISWVAFERNIARYGLISMFLFVFFFVLIFADIFTSLVYSIFKIFTGLSII